MAFLFFVSKQFTIGLFILLPSIQIWGFEKFDSSEWHKKIVFHSEFSEHGE